MNIPPAHSVIIWVSQDDQGVSHAMFRHLATWVALCGERLSHVQGGFGTRCEGCTIQVDILARGTAMNADHPLVKAVSRERAAAGGRWAALEENPPDMDRMRRELEAVLREHYSNPIEMIYKACDYLELACRAFRTRTAPGGQA